MFSVNTHFNVLKERKSRIKNIDNNQLIYLGDWLSKYTVTVIDENSCWQGNWKEFIDLS